jgi:predicted flap endonuclease-1-like 5' DNA nuclease
MIYEVTASATVAASMRGSRNRAGFTFGRLPVYLDQLPAAVAADPHLRVKKLAKLPEGAHLTQPSGGAAAEPKAAQQSTSDPKPLGTPKPPNPDDPVTDITGVGRGTAAKLAERKITTLGHLAAVGKAPGDLEPLADLGLTDGAVQAIAEWHLGPGAALRPKQPPAGQQDDPSKPDTLKPERVQ